MLDFSVALAIGILAGLGVGSGGLLILYLSAFLGADQLTAQGTNLIFFAFALGAALLVHLYRRPVSLPILGVTVLFGATGAVIGSLLASVSNTDMLRTALGLLLLVMGVISLFRK